MYQPDHIIEWHVNKILYFLFTGHKKYMLIFQDGDAHGYQHVNTYAPRSSRAKISERRASELLFAAQDFRPDAILIDRKGQSYVLENKLRVTRQSEFDGLIMQSLVYANFIYEPTKDGKKTTDTYSFLDLLYRANWFTQEYEGPYSNLANMHKWYFGLPEPLDKSAFAGKPKIILLLPDKVKDARLLDAIQRTRKMEFNEYERHIAGTLTSRGIALRINSLKNNWMELRETVFSRMTLPDTLLKPMNWLESTLN